MAKTWEEVLNTCNPQEVRRFLAEKGMTFDEFTETEEWKKTYEKLAWYRFASPEPFMPD